MSSKRYPEEFKIEAVKQVVDRGHSVSSVATRLDITTRSLYVWIKKFQLGDQIQSPLNASQR
jgi:transposase